MPQKKETDPKKKEGKTAPDNNKNSNTNNNRRLPAERGDKGGEKGSGGDNRRRREPIQNAVPENRSDRFLHQFLPWLILVVAIFISACYVCVAFVGADSAVGVVGRALNNFFCGLFGPTAFIAPLILLNLAVFWRKYVDNALLPLKLSFSVLTMMVIAAFVHVLTVNSTGGDGFNIAALWLGGIDVIGGGVLGGLLGELCFRALGIVGSLIVLIPLAAVLLLFLIGTTPRALWLYIRYRAKIAAERRAAARADEDAIEERRARELEKKEKKQEKAEERAKKKQEEERRRRHEALAEESKEPGEAVFTEGEVLVGDIPAEPEPAPTVINLTPAEDSQRPAAAEAVTEEKKNYQVVESVKSMPTEGELLEKDEDYFDINAMIQGKSQKKSSASGKKQESGESDTPDLGLITEVDNLDALIESDEEPADSTPEYAEYVFPPHDLLAVDTNPKEADYSEELHDNAKRLMDTLSSFNVRIKEINYSRGPTITRYELRPDAGVRVRSIANLVDDIALSLATTGVRIEAPIPGKSAVGVEVPNRNQATVFLRTLIESSTFAETSSRLAVCLGQDVAGKPIYFNIDKMPHLIIAGATGMGKSVCINSIIVSLLYKAKPDEVKMILVDPKKVEFNLYKEMPHLYVPVVSDPKKAAGVLATAVAEMERRFEMIEDLNVRDITSYNKIADSDPDITPMPRLVIIIDELADLMMTAPDDFETAICRLAQKARAAGIHLIIGTQRPSVDVITGLIKANIPSRIAFTVASQVDSRTILDIGGAEKLIGRGDMLFAPVGASKPMRVQGAFVGETEVENIVEFIKENNSTAHYDDEFIKQIEEAAAKCGSKKGSGGGGAVNIEDVEGDGTDPKLREAIELALESGKISTSLMQRRLKVGYGRAAKILDEMEELGYIGPADGNKPRQILITKEQFYEKVVNDDV